MPGKASRLPFLYTEMAAGTGKRSLSNSSSVGAGAPRISWDLFPEDIQMKILASLDCVDLFRSCLLVCKGWRNMILSSENFAKLQYRPCRVSNVLLICSRRRKERLTLSFDRRSQALALVLRPDVMPIFGNGGLISLLQKSGKAHTHEVGNPLKNIWKFIPLPDSRLSVEALVVDASTSPSSYKIMATTLLPRESPIVHTQVYNSKTDSWTEGQTLDWEGAVQNEISPFSAYICDTRREKIALYDLEQDKWNLLKYVPPKYNREQIECCLCYNQDLILVALPAPWVVTLLKGSCCNGVIQWGLMAELDLRAFLSQEGLVARNVFLGSREKHSARFIIFNVDLYSDQRAGAVRALVHYDILIGSLHFRGLKSGRGCFINVTTGLMEP